MRSSGRAMGGVRVVGRGYYGWQSNVKAVIPEAILIGYPDSDPLATMDPR